MKQFNKYFTLLGLYIAQSIPMSFFTTVVPVIMRQENYSLESIGLLQLVKIPWILKFLWAPLIDKHANTLQQYKKWIIGSELFYALIILSIAFFDLQTDFKLIVVLVIIAIFASATQDISTDALAILSLKKKQRGMGNAIQSIGGFLGALVGSGLLLIIYNNLGWKALLFSLSGFVLIAVVPLKFFNYKLSEKPETENISLKSILSFFQQKNICKHVVFLLISSAGLTGIMSMVKPYMVDHGLSIGEIGYISGILGTSTAVVFAFLAGYILRKISLKKAISVFITLSIFVGIYFLILDTLTFNKLQITIGICLLWAIYGMINVTVYTLAMNWARKGLEGTDFTLQIVINQSGALIIAGIGGFIAQRLNYQGLFIVEIIIAVIAMLFAIFVYKTEKEPK